MIAEEENRRPAQCQDRRGHDRVLRQARALARAASVHPPLPGIDLPGIFHVRTVPDARTIREWIERGTTFLAGMFRYSGIQLVKPVRRAVVVGGGFIGLEMAENLVHLGFNVTLIQKPDQRPVPAGPGDRGPRPGTHGKAWRPGCRSTTGWSDSSSWKAARSRSKRAPARPSRRTS